MQRHLLYLGEINDSQKTAWCQPIEAFDEGGPQAKQIALSPEDAAPQLDCDVVHVRLGGLQLRHRGNGAPAGWLARYGISCDSTNSGRPGWRLGG
ncbi:MAG: hypothetical protein JO110_21255, partial [Acetobacteraceae bacterium]|nr:hypothetical protein [Acetobacteraceae bacterium]